MQQGCNRFTALAGYLGEKEKGSKVIICMGVVPAKERRKRRGSFSNPSKGSGKEKDCKGYGLKWNCKGTGENTKECKSTQPPSVGKFQSQ